MKSDNLVINFLNDEKNYSLQSLGLLLSQPKSLAPKDLELFCIDEITFEDRDKAPRKEAFENVISSMQIDGVNFIYLIIGDKEKVKFYFGICKNLNSDIDLDVDIDEIGKDFLKTSIEANFRGNKITRLNDKSKIKNEILDKMKYCGRIEGIPGINEDNENIQGVDRLVDTLAKDEYVLAIIASALDMKSILDIEKKLYEVYDMLSPLAKKSIQDTNGSSYGTNSSKGSSFSQTSGENSSSSEGTNFGNSSNESSGTSFSETIGTNNGYSVNESNSSKSEGKSGGESRSKQNGTSSSKSEGTSSGKSTNKTIGTNTSKTSGTNSSEGYNEGKNSSQSISIEFSNKFINEWLKYLDEVLLAKVNYGKSKGMFKTNIFAFTKNKLVLQKISNTLISLFSATSSNSVPLNFQAIKDKKIIQAIKNFQFTSVKNIGISDDIIKLKTLLSQNISKNSYELANIMSSNELSLIAGLPQKEVVGLALKEEVEFGLNPPQIAKEKQIPFGKLIKSGNEFDKNIYLDRDVLDKHIFITGVTGSGKTTTCQKILSASNMPFLVIEPAKTEYRILSKIYDDILIFTLGNDNIAPFRLNPFEFFPHENITSRVDMIKASLESAFDMEAAIPQIMEAAIYRAYEKFGWNIATNININYENKEDAFKDEQYAFPTLNDFIKKIENVTSEQGFDERLKNDYLGSIRARIQGLMIGSKGLML